MQQRPNQRPREPMTRREYEAIQRRRKQNRTALAILAGIAAMEDFYHRIAMPANLKELGIAPTEEQILAMAASCAKASGGKKGSAKVLYEEDMAAIYRMANQA